MFEVCEIAPLVPLTITEYGPVGVEGWVEMVSVDVALFPDERVRLAGLSDVTGPDGEEAADSVMVPEKPFKLESVIALVADEPCEIESDEGLSVMEKSGPPVTVRVTLAV